MATEKKRASGKTVYVVSSANTATTSSGGITVMRNVFMPNGKPVRVINKEIFERAIRATEKKK